MKTLTRNKRKFYYLLFLRKEDVTGENNGDIGEKRVIYGEAVRTEANISAATGQSQIEQFGTDVRYDKVIVTDDMTCPIDENSVLFIDKEPEYDTDGNPLYDYIVKKVAPSLNSISIAVSKEKVS